MPERLPPHVANSHTSLSAAQAIQPHRPNIARRVFDAIGALPSTCEELERSLDLLHQTASARVSELRTAGCIRPSGVTRPSSRLASADVYEVVPGASFALYEAWREAHGHTRKVDTTLLVEAARAFAKARHDNTPREALTPLANALLAAATRTFPNG